MISEVGGSKNPSKIIFFDIDFCMDFWSTFWSKNGPKMVPKINTGPTFSLPKPTLAPKATFGWILVVLWPPFWLPFAPFGSFLFPFWFPLAPFWLPFGFFALSFACFWLAFGSRLLSFAIPSSPFCYFRLRAYKFFKKTGFIRHPRPQSTRFFHFC